MYRPIAVFDAGIGSYAIVAEIKKAMPKQDIVYLADRASFPYGGKSRLELLAIMRRTIRFLETFDPFAIVVASNAPSIMVLDELREQTSVTLFGVFPPLNEALERSASGHVGIMGVRSLVESSMLADFVARASDQSRVALVNASPLVDLVENGSFLFAPERTQRTVDQFMHGLFEQHPLIDVLTLSSTHLPWLRNFLQRARPECAFLDPALDVIAEIGSGTEGNGIVRGLVTEDATFDLKSFREMLRRLDVDIPLEAVLVPLVAE